MTSSALGSRFLPFLLSFVTLGAPGVAHAQQHEAWHFASDESRHARVDDRGGLGEGFSFSIEYDPEDGNSEDFCPHCRFTVMVSDPGVDLAALERLGVERSDVSSAADLMGTIQTLLDSPPAELAASLEPALEGADLEAFVDEVTAILGTLEAALTQLETLASMQTLDFDWTDVDVETLVEALALEQDSAFIASFSDPNDPKEHNSGVAVYGLPELLAGLAGDGVPQEARDALESAVSSIPGLGGAFEVSGDDDGPTAPVVYHAYRTDLTIEQRTYAIAGQSAYLMVFTLVNDTQRVLPFVETSFGADFDIPPLGLDEETDFDGANQAVRVHDQIPYVDPEQHYWFGVAPASAGAPAPGTFSFANWNIDKNWSLVQAAPSIHLNRYRFFLWDPALSGDHDDAEGKSEKQGAVAMQLSGPLMPGDRRSVGFCMTAGEGGSSEAASAEQIALMTACRALSTAVNPTCGDGVVGYGEQCEPSGVDPTCSLDCQRLVCGDERVTGSEECDDGNTTDGDGCSATCIAEICGNGLVQAGEECDDGNASNADACLTTCRVASCGDGFVRDCGGEPGADCGGCAGRQVCLRGTFTLDDAASGPFEPLRGVEIEYVVAFDVASTRTVDVGLQDGREVTTGPVHVEMSGHPYAAAELGPLFEGSTMVITLDPAPFRGNDALSATGLVGTTDDGPLSWTLGAATDGVEWALDDTLPFGLPILETVRVTAGVPRFMLRPDSATGALQGAFRAVAANEGSEACDDGNESDFDACTASCAAAACGDGLLQLGAGEECDEGADPPAWCAACQRVNLASCGNGAIDGGAGEVCDDGNTEDGDGCSALCLPESCGDGVVQAPEDCDDGGNGDGDGCTDACIVERCGDGIVQPLEECDTGEAVSDTGDCLTTCRPAACGDSFVRAGVEDCDDGNAESLDGCSAACLEEVCGDGAGGPGETCDDGNQNAGDGCSPACAVEYCGDALAGAGEQCDDGNAVLGDGCDRDCQLENPEACGDGTVGPGEQCDDGGNSAGDGCNELCQLDDPEACGDGAADPGEGCDDGNDVGGDGCTPFCTVERCGDGIHQVGEECDDGDGDDGDGCSATCLAEPATCGNGTQELGEQCDDGNAAADDGCTEACRIEDEAPLAETCGNGTQDRGEECDDGDRMEGDGCGETCQREAAVCGNGRLDHAESCDDANTEAGDGCGPDCRLEAGGGDADGDADGDGDGGSGDDSGCSCGGSDKSGALLVPFLFGLDRLRRRRRPCG